MTIPQTVESDDKDLPLREDIRLLGRILGDTVREQKGAATFGKVERVRQSSTQANLMISRAKLTYWHRPSASHSLISVYHLLVRRSGKQHALPVLRM
jgi:phosphoenolpyruvate carboxylase